MEKIILDRQVADSLRHVQQKVEIADENGHVIGYFVASDRLLELEANRKALYDMAKCWVTDEELEKAKQEPAVYTMDDVMKLLEKGP